MQLLKLPPFIPAVNAQLFLSECPYIIAKAEPCFNTARPSQHNTLLSEGWHVYGNYRRTMASNHVFGFMVRRI